MRFLLIRKRTANKAVEPTGAPPGSFAALRDSRVTGFDGRPARAPVAHLVRSLKV
jgi:hypothetical protein